MFSALMVLLISRGDIVFDVHKHKSFKYNKFGFQTMTAWWLVLELKEEISILGQGMNPGLQLYVLVL